MLIPISQIKVGEGRREADPEAVKRLTGSISKVGLLNPITVDQEHTLIAGLHRLEAAKLLGWSELECTVSSLGGLQSELAEIDENLIRRELDLVDESEQLARRKEIYEALYPWTKRGAKNQYTQNKEVLTDTVTVSKKSFVDDTAQTLGVSPRTVSRKIQLARNLSPGAKDVVKKSGIGLKNAIKISRLEPEQQEAAASQLADGSIKSVDEYRPAPVEPEVPPPSVSELSPEVPAPSPVPYSLGNKHYDSLEESIADLKNPNKDCSYTPDTLLADIDGFVDTFHKNFAWYNEPFCTVVFPCISKVQFEFVCQRFASISSAMENLITLMEKEIHK